MINSEENCIFCKIISGEIGCYKIYEDEDYLAFLDIDPKSEGHSLLVPKNHVTWWLDQEDDQTAKIFIKAKEIAKKLKENTISDYVELRIIGTDVPHFHIHIIPNKIGLKQNRRPIDKAMAEALSARMMF